MFGLGSSGASLTEAMERVKTEPAGRIVALAATEAPRTRDVDERRADMMMAVLCADSQIESDA